MSRKPKDDPFTTPGHMEPAVAAAEAEADRLIAEANGGEGPYPPAVPAKRKKRDPNAPRPIYLLLAVNSQSDTMRIVGTSETIGRARKAQPGARYALTMYETGPVIARCKLVS